MADNTTPTSSSGLLSSLFGEIAKGVTTGKPRRSVERIDLLLRKTHVVGAITIPIPNIVALGLIHKLDRADLVQWTIDVLFILHHQRDEDTLFATGADRDKAKLRLLKEIPANRLPDYHVAIMETLEAVEKKSQRFLTGFLQQMNTLTSPSNSSPSPTKPDNPSGTSPTN